MTAQELINYVNDFGDLEKPKQLMVSPSTYGHICNYIFMRKVTDETLITDNENTWITVALGNDALGIKFKNIELIMGSDSDL